MCRPPPPYPSRNGRRPTALVFAVLLGALASHWFLFKSAFLYQEEKTSGVAVKVMGGDI